uniref:Uncharacterized protein n=1 Tax=Rangifer tarandus platyrhynchus TaxID=3082113 RepID=A0ACB0EUG4_RANTA|nr:unnamed protein product [Rangifer tarandus platyrhynchus]
MRGLCTFSAQMVESNKINIDGGPTYSQLRRLFATKAGKGRSLSLEGQRVRSAPSGIIHAAGSPAEVRGPSFPTARRRYHGNHSERPGAGGLPGRPGAGAAQSRQEPPPR